ncbi:MAG: alpha/beta hydrolase [Tannerellaceae bacterium]|jgi:pimeloyl-ACP methyl ester carboxylesterase|nr:alpha/beta hydrolase [Tannerellaceae bacterium]
MIRINNNDFNILELNKSATETVVMIHGIFTNLSVFYFSVAHELAKKYHVVLYDLKGHGLSETACSGYDLQSASKDLLGILYELHIRKAHLTGYSYGGLIALYMAVYYPETVDKLIIIETPNLNDGQSRPLLEGYNKLFLDRYLAGLSVSTHMIPSQRKIDKIHRQVQYLFEHTTLKEDLRRDLDLFDKIAENNPVTNETLLLYATQTECANAAAFLHQHIKKSSLYYGKGDHSIPVQNPEWLVDKIIKFL